MNIYTYWYTYINILHSRVLITIQALPGRCIFRLGCCKESIRLTHLKRLQTALCSLYNGVGLANQNNVSFGDGDRLYVRGGLYHGLLIGLYDRLHLYKMSNIIDREVDYYIVKTNRRYMYEWSLFLIHTQRIALHGLISITRTRATKGIMYMSFVVWLWER